MDYDHDVIVCGAGPCGATAAKYLAEGGLDVLIVEKDDFPRDKPCGGGLCPHITDFDYIKETLPGYLECECRRGIIYSESGKYRIDHTSDDVIFYNIRRRRFDHELVKFAEKAGAVLLRGRVAEVVTDGEKATVILSPGRTTWGTTGETGEERTITVKAVIGATGPIDPAARFLRKRNGLPDRFSNDELGTIMVHEFEVGEEFADATYGEERASIIYLKAGGLPGYGWLFSKKSVANIGWGSFTSSMKKISIREEYGKFLERLKKDGWIPDGLTLEKFEGAPLPLKGAAPVTSGERVLIGGDAAGFVSPLSGEGIYYAMMSGKLAAEVLLDAAAKDDFSASSLAAYDTKWKSLWGKDLLALDYIARKLMKYPEHIIRCGEKDEVLQKVMLDIFIGRGSAVELKNRAMKRVARDSLLMPFLKKK